MPPRKRSTRTSKKMVENLDLSEDEIVEPPHKRTRNSKKTKTSEKIAPKSKAAPKKAAKKDDKPSIKTTDGPVSPIKDTIPKPSSLLDSINNTSTPLALSQSAILVPKSASPIKKNFNSKQNETVDLNRAQTASLQAVQSKNIPKLTAIIEDLRSNTQEQIFDNFKGAMEVKLQKANELITKLSLENDQLQKDLQETKQQLVSAKAVRSSMNNNEVPINEKDFLQNELILDMMEQIVGLRIHTVDDTEEALVFDCSQSGRNGILDYRLTIFKEDSSEIIYSPIDAGNKDKELLKECLPDYFFDNLTFPLDTLQQFYHKIYRGLSK